MKAFLRSMMILCMLAGMMNTIPSPVLAQMEGGLAGVPDGLQEAILSSTGKPFQEGGGDYRATTGGVNFLLNKDGLQAGAAGFYWGITLQAYGRETLMMAVSEPTMSQVGGRLEYQRGVVTEWYRDTAIALEQGFTIHEAPTGEDELILQLDVTTELAGELNASGRGLSFRDLNGQSLRYDHLIAFDANGMGLDARMNYTAGRIRILVNDHGAAYPITIDPLIYLEQKVAAADATASDYFGFSVAISGNTALVGAHQDDVGANLGQGSVYVFVRSGATWSQQAQLLASDGATGDQFGTSVAIDGNTALVGAAYDDIGVNSDQGSAYVFVRSGTTWTQQAQLLDVVSAGSDYFGRSVALSGDSALIGANGADIAGNSMQGSASVFTRSGTTWTQQSWLTASDGLADDNFGRAVALSGDTALVSAYYDDVGANGNQGSAYIFVRSGTSWSQQDHVFASDGAANDNFGHSVALCGDTAIVGSPSDDVLPGPVNDQGSAYIYIWTGATWNEQAQLTASDGATLDYFGRSVGLSGDTALVGAQGDNGTYTDQGSAYTFVRYGITWTEQEHLVASDPVANDNLGNSAALSEDTALVGAWVGKVGGITPGSAYFFQAYRTDADLAISTARDANSVIQPGDTLILTTSVMNYGPNGATTVLANVSIPDGLTYVSSIATRGVYNSLMESWSIGTLDRGVSATLIITVTVDPIPNQTLTFAPYILGRDINLANNNATLSLPVYVPYEVALNGRFNTYSGTSKIPQNWVAVNFAATDGKNTTVKKEGAASVMIRNTSAITKTLTQTLTIGGSAGAEFALSFWAKGVSIPATGICRVQVMLYNGAALKLAKTVNCTTGSYVFTQRKLNFTSTSAYTRVVIKLTYAKATGTIYFDWLSLMKAP